ncbi:MAG: SCO family protein [Acidiferrobacterales bacterium]
MKFAPAKAIVVTVVVLTAFAAGLWFGIGSRNKAAIPIVQDTVITVLPKAKTLKPFGLQTATGHPFTLENLKGKYSLLFFGYTSCPDVCPTTMFQLQQLYLLLGKENLQKQYQVVFVSIDPRRDTPARLEKYVTAFDKHFIGATGQKDQISNLAKQLGASYDVEDDGKSSDYSVSHTDVIFIIDPDAQYAAVLTSPHQASRIESRLALLMQVEQQGGNK